MPASMNISLPESLREFVKERAADSLHGTPSAYIRALINDDRKKAAHERLEALILEGLNSGPSSSMTQPDYDAVKQNVRDRIKANASKHK